MTILFANLGTSDISVKIDRYYIPCVNRNEPNMVYPNPENVEQVQAWKNRFSLISDYFEQNFQITSPKQSDGQPKINFREITKRLGENYDQLAEIIRIDRILGVIKESAKISHNFDPSQSLKVYLFLTDQYPEYLLDTIYAYDIVEKYLNNLPPEYFATRWELHKIVIPQDVSIAQKDEDKLLDFYLEKVSELYQGKELVLLSIKGGTQFMQTGLRLPAFAMGLRQQVFIESQLNVEKVLMGEPSDCRLISYWRSQKQSEVKTIKQLLERWDFDGVKVILTDWRKNLKSLQDIDLPDKDKLNETLTLIQGLEQEVQVVLDCWQLDFGDAREKAGMLADEGKGQRYLELIGEQPDSELTANQLLLLNLYAQSKISFECNEIVRFIYGFSTFHEVAQIESIIQLSPPNSVQEGDWGYNLMIKNWKPNQKEDLKNKLRESNKISEDEINNFHHFIPLKNRIIRSCIIRALSHSNNEVITPFDNLDFWYDKRNKLVHGGNGISLDRIVTLHNQRGNDYQQSCQYKKIPKNMERILINLYGRELLESKNLGRNQYFIYDQARDSINEVLSKI